MSKSEKSLYSILGVAVDAPDAVIKAAFRALAKQYHPDGDGAGKPEATAKFIELQDAYKILSEPKSRKEYDERIRPSDSQSFSQSEQQEVHIDPDEIWRDVESRFPEINRIHAEFSLMSSALANRFMIAVTNGEYGEDPVDYALGLQENFLRKYFGRSKDVQWLAKKLLLKGRRELAQELNDAVKAGKLDKKEQREKFLAEFRKRHRIRPKATSDTRQKSNTKTEKSGSKADETKAHHNDTSAKPKESAADENSPGAPAGGVNLKTPGRGISFVIASIVFIIVPLVVGSALLGLFGENRALRDPVASTEKSSITGVISPGNDEEPSSAVLGRKDLTEGYQPQTTDAIVPERDLSNDNNYPKIVTEGLPYDGKSNFNELEIDRQGGATTVTKLMPPEPVDETFRLAKGQTLVEALVNRGVTQEAAKALVASIEPVLPMAVLKEGTQFNLTLDRQIDFYGRDAIFPVELSFQSGPNETITVQADKDGNFQAGVVGVEKGAKSQYAQVNHFRIKSKVGSSLFSTAKNNKVPDYIVSELTRVFAYDVVFQRHVKANDTFEVFYGVPLTGSSSQRNVLHYAQLTLDGKTRTYFRFTKANGDTQYYDENGRRAGTGINDVGGMRLSGKDLTKFKQLKQRIYAMMVQAPSPLQILQPRTEAKSSSVRDVAKNSTDKLLCFRALDWTRTQWDSGWYYDLSKTEALRRGLDINACRAALKLPPLSEAGGEKSSSANADSQPDTRNAVALGKRIALVIGNSSYRHAVQLDNPDDDAELMAKTLAAAGFKVTKVIDADQSGMRKAMIEFKRAMKDGADTSLFYYAGHGVQLSSQNYLIPVDAEMRDEDEVVFQAVNINEFLQTMEDSPSRMKIVVLDACRDNPFPAVIRSISRGLANVVAPGGTFIAYSTGPGSVAEDGEGKNSTYTSALARQISKPGIKIEEAFKLTAAEVVETTGKKQVPWYTSSLVGDFYFVPVAFDLSGTSAIPAPAGAVPDALEEPAPLPLPSPEKDQQGSLGSIGAQPVVLVAPSTDPLEALPDPDSLTSSAPPEAPAVAVERPVKKKTLVDLFAGNSPNSTPAPAGQQAAALEQPGQVAKATAPSGGPGFFIQLGTFRTQAEARKESQRLQSQHGEIVAGLGSSVVPATVAGSTRYGVRVGPVSSREQATQVCGLLFAAGERDCLVRAQ